MDRKNYHRWFVAGELLFAIICGIAIPPLHSVSSETGNWQNYPKWLTGSSTLGNWVDKSNPGYWNGSNWVIKISTDVPASAFFPGRDYYYLYQTTMPALVWDQRERGKSQDAWQPWKSERNIYLPIVGIDLVLPNGTTYYPLNNYILWYGSYSVDSGFWEVYDNWGGGASTDSRKGPPPPPVSLTGELVLQPYGIEAIIQWTAPTWKGDDIKDLTLGGGYELWRSSSMPIWELRATALGPAPPLTYTDMGLQQNTTYYYTLRSYDAYIPADESSFSEPLALYGVALPVDIVFNIDITGYTAERVFVSGDFANDKILMRDDKDGTYNVKVPNSAAPLKLLVGKTIKYRYVKDDDWEPIERTVVLTSTDTRLNDYWGISTVTSTPKNLPNEIVTFRTEPVGTYSTNVLWETNPKELQNIAGYEIQYSTYADFSSYSTITILSVNTSYYFLIDAVDYFKFAIIYKDGTKSQRSDAIRKGVEVPSFVECTDAAPIDNLTAKTGLNTGEIILIWKAPPVSQSMGAANNYIIRKATYPMTSLSLFKKGIITGKEKAHYTGTGEMYVTVPLGENCPGYYFAVQSIYGNWFSATVSSNTVGVAGRMLITKKGGRAEKTVKYLGSDDTSGSEKYLSPPSIEMKRHSVDIANAVFVIKNSFEISFDTATYEKITAATSPQLPSQKRLKFPVENSDMQNRNSTIFSFTALNPSGKEQFAAGQDVKLPFAISIPYDIVDKNNNGLVDSTEGSDGQINVNDLRVYYLNEKYNFWQRLKGKNEVNTAKKIVTAETEHLSVFCLATPGGAATDLSNVVVFPNPFKPYDKKEETGSYETGIIFTNLTPTAEITIYTIAAEVVKEHKMEGFSDDEKEGKWKWDVRNDNGSRVASGVYVFLIKDENVQTGKNKFVGKLCIIR